MKVLELFSGTGSVGKVCKELGYSVVSCIPSFFLIFALVINSNVIVI